MNRIRRSYDKLPVMVAVVVVAAVVHNYHPPDTVTNPQDYSYPHLPPLQTSTVLNCPYSHCLGLDLALVLGLALVLVQAWNDDCQHWWCLASWAASWWLPRRSPYPLLLLLLLLVRTKMRSEDEKDDEVVDED